MAKAKLLDKIPVAIEYKHLPLLHNKEDLNQAVLKLQGQAVEFNAGNSTPILMAAFNELWRFCPEIVFHVGEIRQRYLIFDNQSVPVIRPDDVVSLKENNSSIPTNKPNQELKIDLSKIWTKNQEQYLTNVLEKCLADFKSVFKVTNRLILTGEAPALLFLLVQNLASVDSQEIYYQDNEDSKLIKIK